jgi:PAS domain S-box-containing protein
MVVNPDMTVDRVNKTFLKEFNLSDKDLTGKKCYEIRYGLDRPCHECGKICYMEEVKTKNGIVTVTQEYKATSGEERFEIVNTSPIQDDHGKIVQIVEASRDITERVRLQEEVQKSKTFFENVIKNSADGVVFLDTKGNVLIFNEAMERLTGYTADEIIDKGHVSYFYDLELGRENMRKMRSTDYGPPGKLNPTSMTITAKNGEEIPVTLSASIITIDGKEVGSVGIFTDMREILEIRQDLEEARLQLVQSEKIASVGRMAAGVAHEINNPLSGVLIYAELLKDALKENPQLQKDVQEIIDQTLRCKKIVSELLEFSRQSIGKTSSFSLDHLLNLCLNLLLKQALFYDIKVNISIDPDMPQMYGDIGQLQQVFTNLFISAADAMEGKGELSVEAFFDSSRSRFIIKVSDTGPGIPEELQEKIFDIFFTTKPVGKGTGLGLSISRNIVSLHGGSLTFNCPPEGGTTFIVELPLETITDHESSGQPLFVGLDE